MSNGTMDGAVYVQTNETQNRVIAFRPDADGGAVAGSTRTTQAGRATASRTSPRRARSS